MSRGNLKVYRGDTIEVRSGNKLVTGVAATDPVYDQDVGSAVVDYTLEHRPGHTFWARLNQVEHVYTKGAAS